jgi:hypothetical protein
LMLLKVTRKFEIIWRTTYIWLNLKIRIMIIWIFIIDKI